MRTRVKDFIEVSDHTSLDRLITTLIAIRDSLPESAEPELKMRGDDVFGRRFSISYFRELTSEEVALDEKYGETARTGKELADLAKQIDEAGLHRAKGRRKAA